MNRYAKVAAGSFLAFVVQMHPLKVGLIFLLLRWFSFLARALTGPANPIPEFPTIMVPVIFSVAILMILLASQRIKTHKSQQGSFL